VYQGSSSLLLLIEVRVLLTMIMVRVLLAMIILRALLLLIEVILLLTHTQPGGRGLLAVPSIALILTWTGTHAGSVGQQSLGIVLRGGHWLGHTNRNKSPRRVRRYGVLDLDAD